MVLKDKTVLITGCNRGIGKAILEEFAKNRAKIFAHARNHSPEYASMLQDISQKYGVAKAALMAWTKTLSLEVGSSGIRVNSIAPGIIDAGMGNIFNPEASEKIIQASALKRLGKPQEIAKLAVFLADDDSSYLTGQVIRIDGGQYDR